MKLSLFSLLVVTPESGSPAITRTSPLNFVPISSAKKA
jgi:hypothetical protein